MGAIEQRDSSPEWACVRTPIITSSLDALTTHCPTNTVKAFSYNTLPEVHGLAELESWGEKFMAFLSSQTVSIEELSLDYFPQDWFLSHISLFPNLSTLALGYIMTIHPPNTSSSSLQPVYIPQVSHLIFHHTEVVVSLVKLRVRFPGVSHVEFVQRSGLIGPFALFGGHALVLLVQFLVHLTPNAVIFNITLDQRIPPSDDPTAFTSDDFRPFLQNHSLERLHLASGSYLAFKITDQLLLEMARAWPGLKHLSLSPQSNSESTASLHVLKDLARLCPDLEVLEIPINPSIDHFIAASEIVQSPSGDQLPERRESSSELGIVRTVKPRTTMKSLNIDAPSIVEMNEAIVAEFLMTIFPGLEHIFVPDLPPPPPPPPSNFTPLIFDPPVPMQPQPTPSPPPPDPEYVRREKVIKTWRHVAYIAKEMKRQGTRKVSDALRQAARSNIIKTMDVERELILQEQDEDYFIDDEEDEDVEMSE